MKLLKLGWNYFVYSNKLIFNDSFNQATSQINYIDVGASGGLDAPWDHFEKDKIRVIGFEPDEEECKQLQGKYPERKYYPNALWSESAKKTFYLCKNPKTSSMYPPNTEQIQQFEKQHWESRTTRTEIPIDCVALDSILDPDDKPDFVKVDTQGSELEILKGAQQTLTDGAPMVLLESWCFEVYKGVPMTHEIIAFMDSLGYQIFDYNVAAAWKHKANLMSNPKSKPKLIGFDLLFVKRIEDTSELSEDELTKLAALCEFFGFREYALNLIESSKTLSQSTKKDLSAILIDNNNIEINPFYKLRFKLLKLLGLLQGENVSFYPSLHN